MGGTFTWTIDSDIDLVHVAARSLRSCCTGIYDADFVDSLEIALVEAINNIIEHGYAGRRGGNIAIRLDVHTDKALIEIVDQAPAADPQALVEADPFSFDPGDLDAIPEGGMGVALIHANMDEVEYRPSAGGNVLCMTKFNRARESSAPVS